MWKNIEALDWAKHSKESRGYETISTFILVNHTIQFVEQMRQFITEQHNKLHDAITKAEAIHGRIGQYSGDDSYGDMIHHVIGLGEDYFNSVMNDPYILNDLEIVESFGYAIPYEDEFKKLDINFHKQRAIQALQAITEIMVAGEADGESVETMRQMQNRFMFMATGDLVEATRGFWERTYNEYYKFKANTKQAMFSNILSDAQKVAHLVK